MIIPILFENVTCSVCIMLSDNLLHFLSLDCNAKFHFDISLVRGEKVTEIHDYRKVIKVPPALTSKRHDWVQDEFVLFTDDSENMTDISRQVDTWMEQNRFNGYF